MPQNANGKLSFTERKKNRAKWLKRTRAVKVRVAAKWKIRSRSSLMPHEAGSNAPINGGAGPSRDVRAEEVDDSSSSEEDPHEEEEGSYTKESRSSDGGSDCEEGSEEEEAMEEKIESNGGEDGEILIEDAQTKEEEEDASSDEDCETGAVAAPSSNFVDIPGRDMVKAPALSRSDMEAVLNSHGDDASVVLMEDAQASSDEESSSEEGCEAGADAPRPIVHELASRDKGKAPAMVCAIFGYGVRDGSSAGQILSKANLADLGPKGRPMNQRFYPSTLRWNEDPRNIDSYLYICYPRSSVLVLSQLSTAQSAEKHTPQGIRQ